MEHYYNALEPQNYIKIVLYCVFTLLSLHSTIYFPLLFSVHFALTFFSFFIFFTTLSLHFPSTSDTPLGFLFLLPLTFVFLWPAFTILLLIFTDWVVDSRFQNVVTVGFFQVPYFFQLTRHPKDSEKNNTHNFLELGAKFKNLLELLELACLFAHALKFWSHPNSPQ